MYDQLPYVILLFALFVLPRVLIRARIPAAITSFGIGFGCTQLDLFQSDPTIMLLSMFGIVSLFLLAGLEADLKSLKDETSILAQHLLISLISILFFAYILDQYVGIAMRESSLIMLALLTPSTGFILDSLGGLQMDDHERFWIKSKAIATELLALGMLFVVLQSTAIVSFASSSAVLALMIVGLPVLFKIFSHYVMPYAPRSEFTFLLMTAVVCAFITKKLGVYYLVGAFVVGLAAQRFQKKLPSIASEKMLHAVELFSSFFVPFYFFYAGLKIQPGDFTKQSLIIAGGMLLIFVPFRVIKIMLHRRLALKESLTRSMRIGITMTPTLVFTLVIADILRERFLIDSAIYGGLILYAIFNTVLPSFLYHDPTPEFEEHNLSELDFLELEG
jgi:Kef-type K+ transport system membrane component KefB